MYIPKQKDLDGVPGLVLRQLHKCKYPIFNRNIKENGHLHHFVPLKLITLS